MLSSPAVTKPTALERRGYRNLVRKHHWRIVIYIICLAPSLWTTSMILLSTCNFHARRTYHKRLLCLNIHLPHTIDNVDTINLSHACVSNLDLKINKLDHSNDVSLYDICWILLQSFSIQNIYLTKRKYCRRRQLSFWAICKK